MSKTKSILHTILRDYVPFYEYRGEFCFIKILEKNKILKFFLEGGRVKGSAQLNY